LIWTYAALIVVVLALVIAWAGVVLQRSRLEHRREELEVETRFVAGVLAETLAGGAPASGSHSILEDLMASVRGEIKRRLLVMDAQGRVLADSGGELAPLVRASEAEIEAVLRSEGLYASAPVLHKGQALGTVYLAMPESDVRARVARQWLLLIGPGLLVVLATGAVSLGLVNRLLEPVRVLTQTAREMAEGDLDRRISIDTEDELGDMGHAFNQMADRVTGLLAQQRLFVAHASHELRTPLTSIRLWVEALQSSAQDDPELIAHSLGAIAQQTERLSHMVDQLLDLSRLESGLVSAERTPTDLAGYVRGVVAELAPQFEAKGQSVQLELAETLPRVPLDPDQMHRALLNLLDNASKYTPAGGEIRITAAPTSAPEAQGPATSELRPAWVRVSISDTGPGIAEQDLPHVFDRFYRGEEARAGSEKGAGLGLAIVRCIVQTQHGGRAWVESAPGQGTTVHLALPLNPPAS
jgi:signal transduction histidine kinase